MASKEQMLHECIGRAYCHAQNADKGVDGTLAASIVEEILKADRFPQLGCATTAELLQEITVRCEVNGTAKYRTIDGE